MFKLNLWLLGSFNLHSFALVFRRIYFIRTITGRDSAWMFQFFVLRWSTWLIDSSCLQLAGEFLDLSGEMFRQINIRCYVFMF